MLERERTHTYDATRSMQELAAAQREELAALRAEAAARNEQAQAQEDRHTSGPGSLIDATSCLVSADYHMFGIGDQNGADWVERVLPVGGRLLGVNPGLVLIRAVEDGLDIELRIEFWDGVPLPPPGGHEATETTTVELRTGNIWIDQLTRGSVHDVFNVPPGWYRLRVTGWDGERIQQLYWDVGGRTDFEDDHPDFAAVVNGQYGRERYLAQLWPAPST